MSRFLSHDKTKAALTEYLAEKILDYSRDSPKLVITSASGRTHSNKDTDHFEHNNHEEADTLMICLAITSTRRNRELQDIQLTFFSPDTDVLVLVIANYDLLPRNTSICMASGEVHIQPLWLANLLESFRLQETILQEEYTKLKDEVHFLQTISNNEKAQDDQEREDAMVEQMISIVEQRNNMLLDIDIERLRENEEDAELYEEHEKKEKDEKSQNNFRTEIELNGERPLAALKRQVFMNSSQQGLRKLNKQASEECTIL
ncbi:hypothetical protein GQR58_021722 [Nymphon striatum]|nr:hypothetical protein GQR58_021722 [Nymphon striatum]